jgi:quercetin dioxygenase-like cupin family protein
METDTMTTFRIAKLASLVEGWSRTTQVRSLAAALTAKVLKGKSSFEGAPLAEELTRGRLPAGIQSAWIFVLRPKTKTPLHKHPNSVQYTSAIAGTGTITIGRRFEVLQPFDPAYPDKSVYVIPENTPHAFEVYNDPVVVMSFHTAKAEEIVEVDVEEGTRRKYL